MPHLRHRWAIPIVLVLSLCLPCAVAAQHGHPEGLRIRSVDEIRALHADAQAVEAIGLSDADLAVLAERTSIQRLSLDRSPKVTNAGLAHLLAVEALAVLQLPSHAGGITDAGLALLARLPRLRELHAEGSAITGTAFESYPVKIRER